MRTAVAEPPEGWSQYATRDELLPDFSFAFGIGSDQRSESPVLKISAGNRDAVDGAWVTTIPVTGGKYYRVIAPLGGGGCMERASVGRGAF